MSWMPGWSALWVLSICGIAVGISVAADKITHDPALERIPPEEAAQIDNIVKLTVEQMKKRYAGEKPVLRGVHPKDHGCVKAKFKVLADLPEKLRVGVFAQAGKEYDAVVRFSNADVLVRPDSTMTTHGSRGMAVKLLNVEGKPLVADSDSPAQDFLMVNHPVFAFANVEDYEALSEVLLKDGDKPDRFFAERIKLNATGPDLTILMTRRAVRTAGIVKRIQSQSLTATVPAYQSPPASPVDNQYFSGAPYLFGPDRVMKYSAKPVAPSADAPKIAEPNYLRTALVERLKANAKPVEFDFLVQVRTKEQLAGKIETEIEDACTEWKDDFMKVATITIPPQDFDTPAAREYCEQLFFTPWHGITEHQPLGGINRLKLGVYEASSEFRHRPKKP